MHNGSQIYILSLLIPNILTVLIDHNTHYKGLHNNWDVTHQFIEIMCNGEFLRKDLDEAIDYLNELAEKAHI